MSDMYSRINGYVLSRLHGFMWSLDINHSVNDEQSMQDYVYLRIK